MSECFLLAWCSTLYLYDAVSLKWRKWNNVFCSQEQAEAAKVELDKINAECSELQKTENELKEKEVDVKHEVQKFENVHKENAAKLKHHKDKVCAFDYKTLWMSL